MGGIVIVLYEYRGDLKQHVEGCGLPHWSTATPCGECKTTRLDQGLEYQPWNRSHNVVACVKPTSTCLNRALTCLKLYACNDVVHLDKEI